MYTLPYGIYRRSPYAVLAIRNCLENSDETRYVYWGSASRTLASYSEKKRCYLAMKLPEDDVCLLFLPPNDCIMSVSVGGSKVFESYIPYKPFARVLRERFSSAGDGFSLYRIIRGPYCDTKRSIKDITKGTVKILSLWPLTFLNFDYLYLYEDRIELRTDARDALLVVPRKKCRHFWASKWKAQDLLEYVQ